MARFMGHNFKVGDRVANGTALATILRLISDDALEVVYDGQTDATFELATYFRRI